MTNKSKVICIFGGSGFLGQYVVQDLARKGYRLKIASRIPESAYELKTYGDVGQIAPVYCNYKDETSIASIIEGCDGVVNLIGILYEKRKNDFMRIHSDLPETIARLCHEKKIKQFVHVSALGVEKSKSKYAKSKLSGEKAIQDYYANAVILRPSVVFGPGDSFFNMFAKLATFLPALPLIGGGKTKFQPVYVGDIAESIATVISDKSGKYEGKIYQLAGPEIVTFKEIYQILLTEINRHKFLVPVPWPIAKIQGAVLGALPNPMLTYDQVLSLKTDNIKDEDAPGLIELGIESTAMGSILPRYLSNFKKGGRFAEKKDVA